MRVRRVGPLLAVAMCAACANVVQVRVDVVDQRTALENQVLGAYEGIGDDVKLMASVRSVDPSGKLVVPPELPEGRREAIRAMQRSRFNRDDVEQWKTAGALGEGNDGYLHYRGGAPEADEPFVLHLAEQENADRKVIYARIAATSEGFSGEDRAAVEKVMAGFNRDAARPGDPVQTDRGEWVRKGGR